MVLKTLLLCLDDRWIVIIFIINLHEVCFEKKKVKWVYCFFPLFRGEIKVFTPAYISTKKVPYGFDI